jgi:hypothetical protein
MVWVGGRTTDAEGTGRARGRVRTTLRVAAAGLLVAGAVITVDAAVNVGHTVDQLNSDLFVKDSRAFAHFYRCLEGRMAALGSTHPIADLDGSAVANQLSVFVLALAAIGNVQLDGSAPGRPTIVVHEDLTAECTLRVTVQAS